MNQDQGEVGKTLAVETSESPRPALERKWIIDDGSGLLPFLPREELVVFLPPPFDKEWCFLPAQNKAILVGRVFSAPEECGAAAIALNDKEIAHYQVCTKRLQEWLDGMAERKTTRESVNEPERDAEITT